MKRVRGGGAVAVERGRNLLDDESAMAVPHWYARAASGFIRQRFADSPQVVSSSVTGTARAAVDAGGPASAAIAAAAGATAAMLATRAIVSGRIDRDTASA